MGLARDIVEAARQLPFRQVTSSSIVSRLQQNANLRGNGSTTKWRIERGNATFTVKATVCGIDDPADGIRVRTPTVVTAPARRLAGTTDANPIDYKVVTATASSGRRARTRRACRSTRS